MSTNNINITVNVKNSSSGEPTSLPLEVSAHEAANEAVVSSTTSAAEKAIAQLARSHYVAIVGAHKISTKLLKKILLEALPAVSIRIVNLGLKVLVLAGV